MPRTTHGLYIGSQNVYSMAEFRAVQKKILACAADPRGKTITSFTVREVAAFTGLSTSSIYAHLRKQTTDSCKAPLVRKNGRIVTMNAFVKIARKKGNHHALNKPIKEARLKMESTVDFLFEALY